MLVLSRKVGERITIGDGVVVEVVEVRGRHVRLGIVAPEDVRIWREEVSWSEPSRRPARALAAGPV